MRHSFVLTLLIILLTSQAVQSTTIELPVNQKTLTKVNLSIKYLEDALKNFGTIWENKFLIHKRVGLTKSYLQELSNELSKYNNVIAGGGNSVNGNKNIVIGNYNTVEGSNNWIFVSKFTGKVNGNLLVGQWRIELDKSHLIQTNPRFAISYIDESRNQPLRNEFLNKDRQLCRWDKWVQPDRQKAVEFWKNFRGFSEWRNNWQRTDRGGFLANLFGGLSRTTSGILGGWFGRR